MLLIFEDINDEISRRLFYLEKEKHHLEQIQNEYNLQQNRKQSYNSSDLGSNLSSNLMQEYFNCEMEQESTNQEGVALNDIKKIKQELSMEKRKIKN